VGVFITIIIIVIVIVFIAGVLPVYFRWIDRRRAPPPPPQRVAIAFKSWWFIGRHWVFRRPCNPHGRL
jgi:hypothetical protein